jgi:predicted Ser/Thr protein kinase
MYTIYRMEAESWAPLQRVPKIRNFAKFFHHNIPFGISLDTSSKMSSDTINKIFAYLKANGYKIGKTYKSVDDQRKVFVVYLKGEKYIAKVCNSETEYQALKYFGKHKFGFAPKLYKHKNFGPLVLVIMEFLPGRRLSYYRYGKQSSLFWKVIIIQIIKMVAQLEEHKILHNDLWEDNIIIYKNKARLIDFEYAHQYKKHSKIYSADVMSQAPEHQAEKLRMGWSRKFHVGGDLNQILGSISQFPGISGIPENMEKNIKAIVVHNDGDFPYTTVTDNPATSAKVLLRDLDVIFRK